ncbi:nucleotidyltransferase family protein [Alicyclobacillus dauci]|uniref:Nucleotidyltransferase domain-containing protein n=1 Tax=Alicyclobacillus dauci TaxID=1475485 RepID=A0ABY6Z1Q4_9BACL|nr:nucleotidyltransferase domain-containing protein [Alicyclobacillus dauci]WAH36814.1 nucleotidyltransferase domain-containing protein [Alicyclobacillus dauci]
MLDRFEDTESNLQARVDVGNSPPIESLVPLFFVFPEVRRVILFGSRAREDHEERSDIDLAVDAPGMDILKWDEVCTYITENSNTLLPIDLIWLQRTTDQLASRIQTEGVVVFERENESVG